MFHLVEDVDVMELTNEVYDSVNRYFSVLSHIGYKPDTEVEQLLVFTFLEEMLYGPLAQYITEEDYKTITNSLYCLYGSCMIPFPDYKKEFDSPVNRMLDEYRIAETGILRSSELSELRVKS